jgi:hypothetical protein
MPQTRQEAEAEFEKLGPGVVQGNLENKVYLQGETGGWARAWLARKAAESHACCPASSARSASLAG